tara:strand:+ start:4390 stop:5106 length:717 start_codon:yes stop_codon:yes gene_type:complete
MTVTQARAARRDREFDLDGIVPWGRRLDEYEAFFGLADVRAGARLLDIGGGPASFAAEASADGHIVTAVDPIYAFDGMSIAAQFERTAKAMRDGMRLAAYRFSWSFYGSEPLVYQRRRAALELFLADFKAQGRQRYVPGSLPDMPFADAAFDIALISHLLFLYGDELDGAFHLAAMREALRVAREVRVFPLINLDGRPSSHLPVVMRALEADGFDAELVPVDFEFQIGANKMLRVRRT